MAFLTTPSFGPVRRAAAVVAVCLGLLVDVRAQPERTGEYRLKAAILYNLTKFVDWPSGAFSGPDAPLTLCVLGDDPFGAALDDALRGRSVAGRPLVAKRVVSALSGCHLLFVSDSEHKRIGIITDQLRDASVLTVSEDDTFTKQGGMISLATEGELVRFFINGAATERAHLKVSARLMSMAARRPGGGAP